MRAPTNYAGPRRDDDKPQTTYTQSEKTNMSIDVATVERLLSHKGRDIFSVQPDDSMQKAVDIMREKRIGALLVLSSDGKLVGILSERDIVRKLSETPGHVLKQQVSVLMTEKVQACTLDEPLIKVLARMTNGRFRHMPVTQGDQVLGMVTIGDVVHFRLRELEHEAMQLKQMIVG